MPLLVAVGCSNRSGKPPGVSFHQFPKDSQLHERWTAVVCHENLPPNYQESAFVCSAHFMDGNFEGDMQAE